MSFMMISQNAFADGPAPGTCNNEYDGPITDATITFGNQTYYPLKNSVSFQIPYDQIYHLTFTVKTSSQNNQGNSLPGNVWYTTNVWGFWFNKCQSGAGPNENFTISMDVNSPSSGPPSRSPSWGTIGGNCGTSSVCSFSYTVNYVPGTPQNLQATAGNSNVALQWSPPSGNGGTTITNYKIYRSTTSGNETFLTQVGSVYAYNDTSVTNGQTYFYKVTAVNSVGESSQSNEVSATPSTSGVTVQSVDQNNIPIYGLYTILCTQGTSQTANGSNTCETGSSRLASGFTTVTFDVPQGQTFGVEVYNNASCSFNHWSDNAGNTYRFRLFTASNPPQILTSVYSCGSTQTAPQSPTGLAATAVSSSQINLSWTAPSNNGGSAITGYDIERSTDNGNTWSTIVPNTGSAATTYNDTGLSPSTSYTYRVSAINAVGTSSPSNTASTTTQSATPPPTGIVLNNIQSTSGTTSSSNQITLSNFNAGSGNDRLLVVGISANNNDVSSITFGGVPLTNKAYSFYNNDAEFWYLKNPTGTGDIVVTMNGQTSVVVGAYSFSGVNQTNPLPTSVSKHNTNPNSPNVSITTKFANDWVLDLPSIYGGSTLGSSTCTQQWDANVPDAITGASSSKIVPTPGSVTCKWTASSGDLWDDVAVEVKAAQ